MKKNLLLFISLVTVTVANAQLLTNVWNPTGGAGQVWSSYQFRDAAVNTNGGAADGRVYISSSATTVGIIYYDKASWQGTSAPSTTPDGVFGTTPPSGTYGTASPYGLCIDGDDNVYVGQFGNSRIAQYSANGVSAGFLKQANGTSDLALTNGPRGIRCTGSGANTKIYYANGNANATPGVFEISKSGNGWVETLLFNAAPGASVTAQCVLKHPTQDIIYVSYSAFPHLQRYTKVGANWQLDATFPATAYTSTFFSAINLMNFIPNNPNIIVLTEIGSRKLTLLNATNGSLIANGGQVFSSSTMGGGLSTSGSAIAYSGDTFFGIGSRSAVGGFFEKITANANLPVQFASFTASVANGFPQLQWSTSNELNNKHFVIQSSLNGTQFANVGTVASKAANGTSTAANNYQFTDARKLKGKVFYRLQQVDKDGSISYSSTVSVVLNSKAIAVQLVNNPVQQTLQAIITTNEAKKLQWQLFNNTGKLMASNVLQAQQGDNSLVLPMGAYTAGMYYLNIIDDKGQVLEKALPVLKQ